MVNVVGIAITAACLVIFLLECYNFSKAGGEKSGLVPKNESDVYFFFVQTGIPFVVSKLIIKTDIYSFTFSYHLRNLNVGTKYIDDINHYVFRSM